jgi:hypothetical protein
MSNGNSNLDQLYKKKVKPVKGEGDALYFIGDANSNFIDLYVTDKKGNLIPVVTNSRFSQVTDIKVSSYKVDTTNIGQSYYYGYQYEDNTFKIIRVQKGNIVNQEKASITTGNLTTNWANRTTLTYN